MRRFTEKELLVATHNQGKLEEIAHLFADYDIFIRGAKELNLIEPAETETSFVGNSRIKAHAAAKATGLPALADDSGICVDALGGAPGVYTADWAETPNGRDFDMAMQRVHEELEKLDPNIAKTASFNCVFVLAWPDGHDEVFEGKVEGELVWPTRGQEGHGYDPIFQPYGYEKTFGEMNRWEKNKISHRGVAFQKLLAGCFG